MTTIVGSRRELTLPPVRGPWTASLYELLETGGAAMEDPVIPACLSDVAVLDDDDLQMALYLCYELHYMGIAGRGRGMGVGAVVLRFRAASRRASRRPAYAGRARPIGLCRRDGRGTAAARRDRSRAAALALPQAQARSISSASRRPPLRLPAQGGRPAHLGDPRLTGRAKAALVEIQIRRVRRRSSRAHALGAVRNTMARWGWTPLRRLPRRVPGITLATVNLMSLFGLHRRLRGAIVGHLAVFEMTSSMPNRRYGDGLRRLGFGPEATVLLRRARGGRCRAREHRDLGSGRRAGAR